MNGSRNFRISIRRAYTLIEMIISMVLVSALMSSVWGIMSLYNNLLTAGRDQTTQQQLVRSVFQLIEEDLTRVIVLPPKRSVVSDDAVAEPSTFSSLDPDSDSLGRERQTGLPPVTISLTGTGTAMRLSIRRFVVPVREIPDDIDRLNELGGGSYNDQKQLPQGEAADVPEFQTVVYQLQPPGMTDSSNSLSSGLYRLQATTAEFQSLISQRSTMERSMATDDVAIGRTTLEALLFPAADSLAGEVESSEQAPSDVRFERIPEVVDCRFQYYDGQSWRDDWSSDQTSSLPAAVRISIDVVSSADAEQLSPLNPSSGDAEQFTEPTDDPQVATDAAFSDAAAANIQATRFERTILLDSVGRLKSVMSSGRESPLQ